jgi:hypothetical protein
MYGVLLDRSPIFHNLHCSNIQLLIYLLTRMFFLVYGINIHLFLSWLKMSSSPVSATLLASRGCMVVACLALIGATGGSSNQMFHLIIQECVRPWLTHKTAFQPYSIRTHVEPFNVSNSNHTLQASNIYRALFIKIFLLLFSFPSAVFLDI